MYIKFTEKPRTYLDGTVTVSTNIIDAAEVFSINATKTTETKEITDKNGKVVEKHLFETGYVIIHKTDKTYHKFYFDSHENVDQFMEQFESCLGKNKGDELREIIIEHFKAQPKVIMNEQILA